MMLPRGGLEPRALAGLLPWEMGGAMGMGDGGWNLSEDQGLARL